jgi:hypothetical protein
MPALSISIAIAPNRIEVMIDNIMLSAKYPRTEYSSAASFRAVENPRRDDYFFSGMALLILGSVFFGFARTYFFAGLWNAPLPNRLIHVHAVVFSSWIAFFILQIALVSTNRVRWHRNLGVLGVALATAVVTLGILAATDSVSRGFSPAGSNIDPKTFYAIPFFEVVVFAILVIAAFRFRFSPTAHKRLMLIATISLLGPAINRWPIALIHKVPPLAFAILLGFILMLVAYDIWTLGRVHRATLWAGLTVVISQLLLFPIGQTALWHSFSDRVTKIWIAHNF